MQRTQSLYTFLGLKNTFSHSFYFQIPIVVFIFSFIQLPSTNLKHCFRSTQMPNLCGRFCDSLFSTSHSIINMIQVIVAETCNGVARCQTNARRQGSIAWNRTANNGPHQNGAQTEQSTAKDAAKKKSKKENIEREKKLLDTIHFRYSIHSPVRNSFLWLHRLQMRTTIDVQCGADDSMDEQEIGDIAFRNQSRCQLWTQHIHGQSAATNEIN